MATEAMHPSTNALTEDEVRSAPMEDCHKDLVMRHLQRLKHIFHETDEASIGSYTNKQAALEQLARMTLVLRDYTSNQQKDAEIGDEVDDPIESMVSDLIDAAMFIGGVSHTFAQPIFVNSRLWGREMEIASLMQEISAESADDVIELWNVAVLDSNNKVVPDTCCTEDIGKDVDWNSILFRSRSEDNLLHHYGHAVIEDREQWRKDLAERELEELDLAWPPVFKDPEPNVGRQRKRASTNTRQRPVEVLRSYLRRS